MTGATNWKITRMWEGQTAAIFASGESMNARVAERVRFHPEVRVVVINNTFNLAPWADLLYAADSRWWDVHRKPTKNCIGWTQFDGLKASISETQHSEVLKLHNSGATGFDPNPANLRTGSHGGYQAVHLTIHAGPKRILLCGFDMHGKHWHPEHENPLRTTDRDRYAIWAEKYVQLKRELPAGVEILNCTPGSIIKCFPFVELDDALNAERPCALSA